MKRAYLIIIILILATSLCSASSVPYTNDTAQLALRLYSSNPEKALQLYNEVIASSPNLNLEDLVDVIMNVVKAFNYTEEPLAGSIMLMTGMVSFTGDDPVLLVNRMSQLVASWTGIPIVPTATVFIIAEETQMMPSGIVQELLSLAPTIDDFPIHPVDVAFLSILCLRKGLSLYPLKSVITSVIDQSRQSRMSNYETYLELSTVLSNIGQPGVGASVSGLLATYGVASSVSTQIINAFKWPLEYVISLKESIATRMSIDGINLDRPYGLYLPKN